MGMMNKFEPGYEVNQDLGVGHRDRAKACEKLRVGDQVVTDYSGRRTPHTITETDRWKPSKSGLLFKVTPIVPGTAGSWMDSGWFLPEEV
jgi:hypothetical protein